MKLSTRSRYGLRLCFLVAISQERTVNIKKMVTQTDLSEKYLEQIANLLKKGKIFGSVRGASGGYYLLKEPQDICMREILEILGDGIEVSDCASGQTCADEYCPNRKMFRKIYSGINDILDKLTLQDMIDDYKCTASSGNTHIQDISTKIQDISTKI